MGWKDLAKAASGLVSEIAELAEKKAAATVPPEEAAARVETERRGRLTDLSAAGRTAELTLTVGGGEQGSLVVTLPVEREERDGRLRVDLESPDPVLVGTTSVAMLSVGVPAGYTGPGRYDLADLHRRAEAEEVAFWEGYDVFLNPVSEADDRTWFVDVTATPPPVVEVRADGLDFDLPMASAVCSIRATGTIRW